MARPCGAVAQMGERCNRTAEVRGSIPLGSTTKGPEILFKIKSLISTGASRRLLANRGPARQLAAKGLPGRKASTSK